MESFPSFNPKDGLIFVSIAAYRDAQLVPTVRDCFAKAAQPDRLRFGICWQHGAEDAPLPFADKDRFRILDVDWRESRGACWARAEIMKLWRGEEYFLQVDSHCRFAPGWDERLIAEMALTGSSKPLLSTYATAFTPATVPGQRENLGSGAHLIAIQGFTPEGLPLLKPVEIALLPPRTHPLHARFLAAGFIFTSGNFVKEVGYDPELYFFGEEIAMTLRSYTHGYDLFHPHQSIVWHDYVRSYAKRHWQDHASSDTGGSVEAAGEGRSRGFEELDQKSRNKIHRLLSGEPVDTYGLGPARTLAEYEQYAGISFRHRKVQDYTRRSLEPPNPPAAPGWEDEIYPWLVRVMLDPKQLSPGAFNQPSFWYVALHDGNGHEIYRRDFPGSELQEITGDEDKIALVCELESGIIPVSWTVWPVNSHNGWLNKLRGTLADDDYAIVRD